MADDDKDKNVNDDKNGEEKVSKADFDKAVGERDKLQQDMDDVRAEVFTPEYMKFLDDKDKKPIDDKKPEDDTIGDDTLSKMSNKEILELATKNAIKSVQATIDTDRKDRKTQSDATVQKEVARFAHGHKDYEKFRPVMYGLSLLPKNKDMGLQELYDLSKVHVKSLQEGPTEDEKKTQRSMDGMKPGQDSGTYSFDKKVDGDTAAKEAAEETAEKMGPLPSA